LRRSLKERCIGTQPSSVINQRRDGAFDWGIIPI
jgi:hypothetical protein